LDAGSDREEFDAVVTTEAVEEAQETHGARLKG
jgi:hypothetical protein